jgi:hypothetical protein
VLESKVVVDYVNGAMRKYSEQVETMAGARCTRSQLNSALEAIYGKPVDKMSKNLVSQLNHLFYNGKGNEGQTYYDAFNAVTEYASHHSQKSQAGRFKYAQFGQGARINQRAMSVLTELAAV